MQPGLDVPCERGIRGFQRLLNLLAPDFERRKVNVKSVPIQTLSNPVQFFGGVIHTSTSGYKWKNRNGLDFYKML